MKWLAAGAAIFVCVLAVSLRAQAQGPRLREDATARQAAPHIRRQSRDKNRLSLDKVAGKLICTSLNLEYQSADCTFSAGRRL